MPALTIDELRFPIDAVDGRGASTLECDSWTIDEAEFTAVLGLPADRRDDFFTLLDGRAAGAWGRQTPAPDEAGAARRRVTRFNG
ncbi:MAG: hypothetical protein ACRDD1_18870, partial [Planctomycetia bacterium]